MTLSTQELQNRLWATAEQLRVNYERTFTEYRYPVLGLVFLRFVDQKFSAANEQLEAQRGRSSRKSIGNAGYMIARCVKLHRPGQKFGIEDDFYRWFGVA